MYTVHTHIYIYTDTYSIVWMHLYRLYHPGNTCLSFGVAVHSIHNIDWHRGTWTCDVQSQCHCWVENRTTHIASVLSQNWEPMGTAMSLAYHDLSSLFAFRRPIYISHESWPWRLFGCSTGHVSLFELQRWWSALLRRWQHPQVASSSIPLINISHHLWTKDGTNCILSVWKTWQLYLCIDNWTILKIYTCCIPFVCEG